MKDSAAEALAGELWLISEGKKERAAPAHRAGAAVG